MTDDWRRISAIFEQALTLDPAGRERLLAEEDARHPGIAAELRAMLRAHDRADGFLDHPAWEAAPELLAHHFAEAGLTENAIAYWLKAGQRSRERSAFCEAIGHLTKGLALLDTLEASRSRDDWELPLLTTLAP